LSDFQQRGTLALDALRAQAAQSPWGVGHCQLRRPWYARCVGGTAARVASSFARLLCCPL
jgi:hypothetical protein